MVGVGPVDAEGGGKSLHRAECAVFEIAVMQVSLDDPENNWKRDFNRVISGLHTSISANIIDSMEFESGMAFPKTLNPQP